MSINQRAYLKAMGIDVWVERAPHIPDMVEVVNELETGTAIPSDTTNVSESLAEKPVKDVVSQLNSVAIEPAEPEIKIDTLDWNALRSTVTECQLCELSKDCNQKIFATGIQTASLMIVGDAPNDEDERAGEPFAGDAGQLLTAMLKAMGYQRKDVYISNLVKCKTTENQAPSVDEVAACEPYLIQQINLLQPKLILALGGVAAQRLLKNKSPLGRLRGQVHYIDGISIPIIVSFDPDYLLSSANEKRKAWEDLQLAMKELSVIEEKNK